MEGVARVTKMGNAYLNLGRKPQGKRQHGAP
jgi:hypothetical protein